MKRAAILALFVAAAATADESPQSVGVLEVDQGQAVQFQCVADGGCIAMSQRLLGELLKQAANAARASCGRSI